MTESRSAQSTGAGATLYVGPGWVFHWSTEEGFQAERAAHRTWRLGLVVAARRRRLPVSCVLDVGSAIFGGLTPADFGDSNCGAPSPESRVPCHLPGGHEGAHEAQRGPYALSSWANTGASDQKQPESETPDA